MGFLFFLSEKSTFSELKHLFLLLVSRRYDHRISENCQIIFQLSVGFLININYCSRIYSVYNLKKCQVRFLDAIRKVWIRAELF